MAVSLTICNLALGDLRAPAIADIGEDSVEAQACARYYPHCLALMIDDYTWQFCKGVEPLALLSTNVRLSEWAYAYALPADCGQALRLLPNATSSVSFTQYNWPYDKSFAPNFWTDFAVEAGVLYAQVADAVLEYSRNVVAEDQMPPLFREALRKLLAANIAVPLRDSQDLKLTLLKEAEAARQAAMANDMNRAPQHEPIDDVAWARR